MCVIYLCIIVEINSLVYSSHRISPFNCRDSYMIPIMLFILKIKHNTNTTKLLKAKHIL